MAGQTRINGNLIDTGTDPEDIVSISAGDARYPKLDGPNTLTGNLTVSGAINANNALSVAGDITASSGSFTGNVSATLDALSRIVNSLPPLVAFPGAAAAYSLRDLNATNQDVVRVRRSSDNTEQDFSAVEIQNGSLTNFVNEQNPLTSTKIADFGSGAAAAYSLRYVSDSYTGPVVRVRRDSDNTEQDFTPSEIEDGSLESFCGSDDGLVTTWYDQSGSGNDAVQTTASDQPKIVDAGTLVTENGRPALDFDGVDDHLVPSSSIDGTVWDNDFTLIAQVKYKSFSAFNYIFSGRATRDITFVAFNNTDTGMFLYDGDGQSVTSNTLSIDQNYLFTHIRSKSNGLFFYENNSLTETDPFTGNAVSSNDTDAIGARYANNRNDANYYLKEIILYPSDQSSNRVSIETDINSYYQIYEGDNEGHVTTWYDQSGSGNDATQTTASDQPKIVTAGVLVTENGRPALDFDGSNDFFASPMSTPSLPLSAFGVAKANNFNSSFKRIFDGADSSNRIGLGFYSNNNWQIFTNAENLTGPTNSGDSNQNIFSVLYSTTESYLDINGDRIITGSHPSGQTNGTNIMSDYTGSGGFIQGTLQEIFFYPSDQSSNRELIETNINNHYGIF